MTIGQTGSFSTWGQWCCSRPTLPSYLVVEFVAAIGG
jgi:hypothetical protein